MQGQNIKNSIIIGIAIIIAGLITGAAIYTKNTPPPQEKTEVQPTDFKKFAEAAEKAKAEDFEGATKLLAESYNERLQIVLKNKQTNKRLLKTYEDSLAVIETDEKILARYLFDIGGIKIKQKKYAEANAYYTEAVRLHPENSMYISGLGLTFKTLGRLSEALGYYEKALKIDKKAYGENTDTARDLNNIAGIWDAKQDYKKALEYYKKAEAILAKSVGKDNPFMEIVAGNIKGINQKLNASKQQPSEQKTPKKKQ
ncbi:MAG: tetratricopeptide repeat protein [Deltaproteobacteria bacterium]|nr:tetratricopeptide repeat protein [Deltaproteobacteria bacterium]